ncbi:alpha/beta hydrolase-fold protein [Streptomyces sp. NPDC005840]|uniref:Alpha/beta hydrolase-fold protein n=1 Tax=Streptomyces doudnae TaxID=3075536 RepID=A0ABD5EKA9_9ACTN|nr:MULTISPECIES: alpha/beta hydrolase-fold protein [unclassified Streptomyces]MDT0434824.1 alpha/beta hydrolase-fold protein [Streptomyces sp. DSM 41981]MYQ63088.1 esterase [Streptomyces sp. SID4950]SCD50593.1 S-formylglutathione hydrolase FrmB [Streptomyces sp. SolWspMP-5a-2]
MSLTGTPFLCLLIVLCAIALVLPLGLWSRLRGPRALRAAVRTLMLLFAQGTAVALVFVLVNNANSLYDDWADLLGTGDHVQRAADLGTDGTGGIALNRLPEVRQRFTPATGPGMDGVRVTQLRGRVSGVDAEVYVWLPPQYDEPAYRHRAFPVVELLPGYPGSAKAWFGSLDATRQLAPLMRDGRVAPFILVAPRTNLLAGVDTGCANIPGTVNADSWLSVDVPRMVTGNFRAEPAPRGWAVSGYSAGGHCAAKLAVAHPDRYLAAVSLSGYNDPIGERDSLAAQTPALRAANNPYLLLRRAAAPPRVALYLSGQPHDGYEAAVALAQTAKAPTTVHVVYVPRSAGGHTMALWRPQVVPSFRWLTQEMGGHRAAAGGAIPPAPSSGGSTHAALASGTASRAGAGRRR